MTLKLLQNFNYLIKMRKLKRKENRAFFYFDCKKLILDANRYALYDLFINKSREDELKNKLQGMKDYIKGQYSFLESVLNNSKNTENLYSILWNSGVDPCHETIPYCEIDRVPQNCSDIFQILPTSKGPCCIFNIMPDMYNESPFAKVICAKICINNIFD